MQIFPAFLNLLRDSANNSPQSVSKNSLFVPVHMLKVNPLENKQTWCPVINYSTATSSEKETNNVSSTAFILFATGNS